MIYLLVALKEEFKINPDNTKYKMMYTGVGKVNAAIAATWACLSPDCSKVINYGTAGTLKKELNGQFLKVGKIVQRDMDARPQAMLGTTPFENTGRESELIISDSQYVLSTGDDFVTSVPELASDIVDMEAYAIAKACMMFNKEFECYKYVTDLADENAAKTWAENQSNGAEYFKKILLEHD